MRTVLILWCVSVMGVSFGTVVAIIWLRSSTRKIRAARRRIRWGTHHETE